MGMSFSNQILTLVAVVLGGSISFIATYLVQRASWLREQKVRWDERRLSVYIDYLNAVKELVFMASRLASEHPLESGIYPLERTAENFSKLAEAEMRRTTASDALRMFGGAGISTAARAMTRCAWKLSRIASGETVGDLADWRAAYAEYEDARDEYVICARRILNVSGGILDTSRLRSFEWNSGSQIDGNTV
jgi:hypothetical protein